MSGSTAGRIPAPLTDSEMTLIDLYTPMDLNASDEARSDSVRLAAHTLAGIISDTKADGSYWLPDDLGTRTFDGPLPEDAYARQTILQLRQSLPGKRLDGMIDQDFTRFWNTTEVERRMPIAATEGSGTKLLIPANAGQDTTEWSTLDRDGYSQDAADEFQVVFAVYAHPADNTNLDDPHRPLPFEVQARANAAIGLVDWDAPGMRDGLRSAASVNAFYRNALMGLAE
jgi:hypothetical protein